MSRAQWTVLGLLIALVVLQVAFSPGKSRLGIGSLKTALQGGPLQVTPEDASLYVVAALAAGGLILLADYAPRVAITLAALLLLAVGLAKYVPLADWLDNATRALTGAHGVQAMNTTPRTPQAAGILGELNMFGRR
jgi:hypothetical protein